MYSYHSIIECFGLFSGVKLSIRSFVLFGNDNCGKVHGAAAEECRYCGSFCCLGFLAV